MGESVGRRIKTVRKARKLTLAKLAEMANLSASHLSQIERDRSTPSLMTLASVAKALEVNLRDLFESEQDQFHIARIDHDEEDGSDASLVTGSRLTSPETGWNLEVDRLTLYPGAPCLEFEPYSGEVLGYVLKGTLLFETDDGKFELQEGDSIHYDANHSYRLCCRGEGPCTVIWCNSPPRYDTAARFDTDIEGEHVPK